MEPNKTPDTEAVPAEEAVPSEAELKKKKRKKRIISLICYTLTLVFLVCMLPALIGLILHSPFTPFDTDPESLARIAPIDEEAAASIDAMPAYSEDDTWAVYVYLVGSNLESSGMNELSLLTEYLIDSEVSAIVAERGVHSDELLSTFVQDVTSQGVDLPQILYRPSTASYQTHDDEAYEAEGAPQDAIGYASSDFRDMMDAEYSDKLRIVVQTGGARRWQNSRINPNRSQRFLMSSAGIEKVYDEPLVNMADPDTLTDFIRYCADNYPADHTMLLLWDHGGGFKGFGWDEIYGNDNLSLADLRTAIENAVGCDKDDPFFEVIGFDACLMASLEAAHELSGLGRYLLASEETEPATGWDYLTWVRALSQSPGMNGAQLGRIVADSYVELSLSSFADFGYVTPTTFSVIDLAKADKVYDAYCAFADAALKKLGGDRPFLAELSRAARSSIAYTGSSYKVYNTIDLGLFMEELASQLPEAENVLKALHDAVLYIRSSSYIGESTGLSVYFPTRIEGIGGLSYFLDYLNDVSESDAVNALYYYKLAGCLNDELSEYAASVCGSDLKTIDYAVLADIPTLNADCLGDGNLAMNLSGKDLSLLQDARLGIARYDAKSGDIEYYGEDVRAFIDEDGSVRTDFNGSWLQFGGHPLPLEVMSDTGEYVMYSSNIQYNALPATLITGYSAETGEVSVLGVRLFTDAAGLLDRSLLPLRTNDLITICYQKGNLDSNVVTVEEKSFLYREGKTKLEEVPLSDGTYYEYILFEDLRCDTYYSPIASLTVKGGNITDQQLDTTLFGYDKS